MHFIQGILLFVFGYLPFITKASSNVQNQDPLVNEISDYECNQNGYLEFLKQWSIQEKASSRDPSSLEFQERLQYFMKACTKIHQWNKRGRYQMEFTYYADWSAEEFDVLSSSTQQYSGIKAEITELDISINNTSYRWLLPSLDPCDDVIEGGNNLRDTINKPQSCSVSWAFAITNSIEYAVKKMYKEEYDQIVNIALSAQELIDCAGKDQGIENGCEGIPVAWGFDYVFENGIAYRQYYPHTNVYGECKEISDNQKYHIAGYEKPSVYNKLGLFELLKKGPVAVTLGLDPGHFQFYQNDRETGPYFDSTYWKPSIYGVVVEYHQNNDNTGMVDEWPYFAIEINLRGCNSVVFRLPIRDSIEDANIGGIAGFAILPIVNSADPLVLPSTELPSTELPSTELPSTELPSTELPSTELPLTELPSTEPPTTEQPFDNPLIIENDDDCEKLMDRNWTSIVVKEERCHSLLSLSITDYPFLKSIHIGKDALINIQTLTISNNDELETITIDHGFYYMGALYNVQTFELTDLPKLTNFTTGDYSFSETTDFTLSNLPSLTVFSTGIDSFYFTTTLQLEDLPNLTIIDIGDYSFSETSTIQFSNLPNLVSLSIGVSSFAYVPSLTISNLPQLSTIMIKDASFYMTSNITISNLTQLTTFSAGEDTFADAETLTIENLPQLTTCEFSHWSFWSLSTFTLSQLPKLSSFSTGEEAFFSTTSLYLDNVPFEDGVYTHGVNAFSSLSASGIISKDSSNLENQIKLHLSS